MKKYCWEHAITESDERPDLVEHDKWKPHDSPDGAWKPLSFAVAVSDAVAVALGPCDEFVERTDGSRESGVLWRRLLVSGE